MKQPDATDERLPSLAETLVAKCECATKSPRALRYMRSVAATGDQSDVSIVIQERKYPLHRVMLAQSSFFQGLLNDAWHTPMEGCAMRVDFALSTTTDVARTLYAWETAIANMYGVCSTVLASRLSTTNFLDILEAALYFDLPELLETCCTYYGTKLANCSSTNDAPSEAFATLAARVMAFCSGAALPKDVADLLKHTVSHLEFLGPHPVTRAVLSRCSPDLVRRIVTSPGFWFRSEFALFEFLVELRVAPADFLQAVRFSKMSDDELLRVMTTPLALQDPIFRPGVREAAFAANELRATILAAAEDDARLKQPGYPEQPT
ncbi:hypothetical protein H9P43_006238 [Blastocladiella emersonii ATCC 22665]|nr:hypothetical protein H9P43_006238 [Blastocladiella emersonii ATCC 22665]